MLGFLVKIFNVYLYCCCWCLNDVGYRKDVINGGKCFYEKIDGFYVDVEGD